MRESDSKDRPVATQRDYDTFSRIFNQHCNGGLEERRLIEEVAIITGVGHVLKAPAVRRLVDHIGGLS